MPILLMTQKENIYRKNQGNNLVVEQSLPYDVALLEADRQPIHHGVKERA